MEKKGINNEWQSILGRGMRNHRGNYYKICAEESLSGQVRD